MKREILRIEPKSALKMGFFMGMLGGFLFGLFEAYMIQALAGSAGAKLLPAEASQLGDLGAGGIIMLAIMLALFSSLIGSVVGVIVAAFYNYISRLFGGLEITVSEDPAPQHSRDSYADSSDNNFNE